MSHVLNDTKNAVAGNPTFAVDNRLMWDCAFIVVSVMKGKVADTKLWVHVPGSNDFRESQLTVR